MSEIQPRISTKLRKSRRIGRTLASVGGAFYLASAAVSPVDAQSAGCNSGIEIVDRTQASRNNWFELAYYPDPKDNPGFRPSISDRVVGDGRSTVKLPFNGNESIAVVGGRRVAEHVAIYNSEEKAYVTDVDGNLRRFRIVCDSPLQQVSINKAQATSTPTYSIGTPGSAGRGRADSTETPTPEKIVVTATSTAELTKTLTPVVVTATPTLELTKTPTPVVVTATPTLEPTPTLTPVVVTATPTPDTTPAIPTPPPDLRCLYPLFLIGTAILGGSIFYAARKDSGGGGGGAGGAGTPTNPKELLELVKHHVVTDSAFRRWERDDIGVRQGIYLEPTPTADAIKELHAGGLIDVHTKRLGLTPDQRALLASLDAHRVILAAGYIPATELMAAESAARHAVEAAYVAGVAVTPAEKHVAFDKVHEISAKRSLVEAGHKLSKFDRELIKARSVVGIRPRFRIPLIGKRIGPPTYYP